MKGKSSTGNLCRDVAEGASHEETLYETGPGGDRLNRIPVGLDGIPRYRKRVWLYVVKCPGSLPGKQGGTADFPSLLWGVFFCPKPGSRYQDPFEKEGAQIPERR